MPLSFADHERFFSSNRMSRYLLAAGGDPDRAIRMFLANLEISQAFYPLLHTLEVCLRNQLNHHIGAHLGNPHWIVQEKHGFMSDHSLGPAFKLRKEVDLVEARLRVAGRRPSSVNVLAEQTLGFWVSLYDPQHFKILKAAPIRVFSSVPKGTGRKEVFNALHEVRKFRNRIHHNEPICFRGQAFDFSEAIRIAGRISDLAHWIDPAFAAWLQAHAPVQQRIQAQTSV